MNYTELVAAIKAYCDNTETTFVNNIPTFVKQAEDRIYRSVNLPVSRKIVDGSLSTSTKLLTFPSDLLAPLSLAVTNSASDQVFLINKDYNFMSQAYPDDSVKGFPKHYAIYDEHRYRFNNVAWNKR